MLKKLTTVDILMLGLAIVSLIFSNLLFYDGEENAGLFVGLWVPSILGFAAYLKLLKRK